MIDRWPSVAILGHCNVPIFVYVLGHTRNMSTYMYPLSWMCIQNAPTRHTVGVRSRICVPWLSRQVCLSLPLYGAFPTILTISAEHTISMTQLVRFRFSEKLHVISLRPATTDDATATTVSLVEHTKQLKTVSPQQRMMLPQQQCLRKNG